MAEERPWRLSIISIWIGILIPIAAALIPYGYRYFVPERELVYALTGPITVKGTTALSINISNKGEHVEKNVKIWLPMASGIPDTRADGEQVAIDAEVPTSMVTENGKFVISLGDLRPQEDQTISVSSDQIWVYRGSMDRSVSVKSDENVAKFLGPSELEEFFNPFGFWMFIFLMILILVAGIYQEYFMDPKAREAWLLKEIDKLAKVRKT